MQNERTSSCEKVDKVRKYLLDMQCKDKTNLLELQSLIRLLNFACLVVVPSRAFLWRLIDLTCGPENQQDVIDLSDETKADIDTSIAFLSSFNGKSVFLSQKWFSSDHLSLYTDGSVTLGFAAILDYNWFMSHWQDSMKKYQIAIKELYKNFWPLRFGGRI